MAREVHSSNEFNKELSPPQLRFGYPAQIQHLLFQEGEPSVLWQHRSVLISHELDIGMLALAISADRSPFRRDCPSRFARQ